MKRVLFLQFVNLVTLFVLCLFSFKIFEFYSKPLNVLQQYAKNKTIIKQNKVILLTIDGIRWQDIFSDNITELMPIFHKFEQNGMIIGKLSDFKVENRQHISLPGYCELIRGEVCNNCVDNNCISTEYSILNLIDKPVIISSWEKIYYLNSNKNSIISSGINNKLNWNFIEPSIIEYLNNFYKYRLDKYTQEIAINYLLHNKPQFIWVAFGDGDDYAHLGDYDKYKYSLNQFNNFLLKLLNIIDLNEYSVIITTDHGRGVDWRHHGKDVESAKIWALIFGNNIPNLGYVKYSSVKYLSDIYATILNILNINKLNNSLLNVK